MVSWLGTGPLARHTSEKRPSSLTIADRAAEVLECYGTTASRLPIARPHVVTFGRL